MSASFYRPVRSPYQGQPLAFDDLGQRHLFGDGIAKPLVEVALAPRRPRGREVQPFVGKNRVFRHAVALVVAKAQSALSESIALLGGAQIEIGSDDVILRHAETVFIAKAQPSECTGTAVRNYDRLAVDSIVEVLCGNAVAAGCAGENQRNRSECFIEGVEHRGCSH